jgi:Family of unknown function (DUF6504)
VRAIQDQIEVTLDPGGHPAPFRWQTRRYAVQAVLDSWAFGGRWWLGEAPRECYLVQAELLFAELHHDRGGIWWLARLQD